MIKCACCGRELRGMRRSLATISSRILVAIRVAQREGKRSLLRIGRPCRVVCSDEARMGCPLLARVYSRVERVCRETTRWRTSRVGGRCRCQMSGTTSIKEVWEVVCVEAIAEQNQKGDVRTVLRNAERDGLAAQSKTRMKQKTKGDEGEVTKPRARFVREIGDPLRMIVRKKSGQANLAQDSPALSKLLLGGVGDASVELESMV